MAAEAGIGGGAGATIGYFCCSGTTAIVAGGCSGALAVSLMAFGLPSLRRCPHREELDHLTPYFDTYNSHAAGSLAVPPPRSMNEEDLSEMGKIARSVVQVRTAAEEWVWENFKSLHCCRTDILIKIPFTTLGKEFTPITVDFSFLRPEETAEGKWVQNLVLKSLVENLVRYATYREGTTVEEVGHKQRAIDNIKLIISDPITWGLFDDQSPPFLVDNGHMYTKSTLFRLRELRNVPGQERKIPNPFNSRQNISYGFPFHLMRQIKKELMIIPEIAQYMEEEASPVAARDRSRI